MFITLSNKKEKKLQELYNKIIVNVIKCLKKRGADGFRQSFFISWIKCR